MLAGDGPRFLGLRSCGPIALSACSTAGSDACAGVKLRGRQCSRFRYPLDHLGLIASVRRKRRLDVLDRRLELLVRHLLDRIAVLDLVLARAQQCQKA